MRWKSELQWTLVMARVKCYRALLWLGDWAASVDPWTVWRAALWILVVFGVCVTLAAFVAHWEKTPCRCVIQIEEASR